MVRQSSQVGVDVLSRTTNTSYAVSERDRVDESDRDSTTVPITSRPNIVRRETDQILSYYQSEHAGQLHAAAEDNILSQSLSRRETSSESYSPSEYSSDSESELAIPLSKQENRDTSVYESAHTRRPSVPSEGSSDRRRLAIVELDSPAPPSLLPPSGRYRPEPGSDSIPSAPSGSLQSRRGLHLRDLALVAPPDASPKTYTDLTPPPTAPIIVDRTGNTSTIPNHHRSASAATHSETHTHLRHKSSRDVGIVGTTKMSSIPEQRGAATGGRRDAYEGLKPPIFQTPAKSRSPSPAVQTPELSDSATSSFHEPYQVTPVTAMSNGHPFTPEIGGSKDIKQSVVGPVVVNIGPNDAMRRQMGHGPAQLSPQHSTLLGPRGRPVSPYVHYEPGLHATAGPLPTPPRSIFEVDNQPSKPPPRPPRLRTPFTPPTAVPDIIALKESLQLPKSVSDKLASRSSSRTDVTSTGMISDDSPRQAGEYERERVIMDQDAKRSVSIHRREGAFPPSSSGVSPSTTDSPTPAASELRSPAVGNGSARDAENTEIAVLDRRSLDGPPVLVASPSKDPDEASEHSFRPELRHQSSWVSIREEQDTPSQGRPALSRHSTSDSRSFGVRSPPPPPKPSKLNEEGKPSAGSSNPFRATLSNLKRFSALPRTPSQLSMDASVNSRHNSRTPSPSYLLLAPAPLPRPSPQQRTKARWPRALQYDDVLVRKSALERSKGYAEKINELAQYDCGLSDWVMATKYRGNGWRNTQNAGVSIHGSPRAPSTVSYHPQPRHTSHGSMGSDATFPVRADAYTATDLSMRDIDEVTSTKEPPPLPYPSLAGPRHPNRASTLLVSSQRYEIPLSKGNKSSGAGFFASFGRKSSLKKDRGLALSPPSPSKVLSKRLPNASPSPPNPRPVQLATPPSIPGGPRTVPTRMQRSQTISVSPTPPSASVPDPVASTTSTEMTRRHTQRQSVNRRPSLFNRGTSAVPGSTSVSTTDRIFEDQVDKLADLLPHADRQILAGYLSRSGQDILAIGQYLEDEKNGNIRRD